MSSFPSAGIYRLPIEHALDRMMDGFVLLDPEYRILYMNPAAEMISGTRAEEVAGRSHWEVWPATLGTEIESRFRAAVATATAQHFEYTHAGESRDLCLDIHAYPSEVGLAVYFHGTTERRREQAESARIERAYKAALSNTPDLVYVFDLQHRFTYANEALLRMWGRTWDDSIGKTCLELGYPDWHAAMHDREIEQVIATKAAIRGVVPFTGTHGRRFYDYIFVPVLGVDGEVEAIAGTTRDVTERHQAEEAIRASEERLRLAQNAAQIATWDWNSGSGTIAWAAESAWIFGVPFEEVATLEACVAAIHPEDRQATVAAVRSAVLERSEYRQEFRTIWPDGSIHWIHGRGKTVDGVDGQPLRLIGIASDITAQKQAEEILRNERRLLIQLFEQAPAFMAWMSGPNHVFEIVNPRYQELIGQRNLIGQPVIEAVPEAEKQGFIALLDRVYQTGEVFRAFNQPIDLARSPGQSLERRYLNFVYQPMREANGSVSGVIALGVDVTETVMAEEALRQSEKLVAAGRLAASIAHEINNPLEAVTNLLYLIRSDSALTPVTRSWVEAAEAELARVSQIATQTLRFYRQSTKPTQVDVREVLDSVASLYERRIRASGISLQRKYSAEPAQPLLLFEGEVRQVIANLVGNAIDALGTGGRIILRQREATDWRTGRRGILITVADTGHGMSCEVMAHIFDPFFSTKGITGTGLGLWISKGIIEKHHGRIRVRSCTRKPHAGTVFTLFLTDLMQ